MTDRPFEFPGKYDFDKAFTREFGLIKGDNFKVEVEFDGWAAEFVSERTYSQDQKIVKKGKGKIRLSFTASSEPETISWILSFGEEARVIKPKWLVGEVAGKIKAMDGAYAG